MKHALFFVPFVKRDYQKVRQTVFVYQKKCRDCQGKISLRETKLFGTPFGFRQSKTSFIALQIVHGTKTTLTNNQTEKELQAKLQMKIFAYNTYFSFVSDSFDHLYSNILIIHNFFSNKDKTNCISSFPFRAIFTILELCVLCSIVCVLVICSSSVYFRHMIVRLVSYAGLFYNKNKGQLNFGFSLRSKYN